MADLHVFRNDDGDHVVAESEADAMAVWLEHTREKAEDYPAMTWRRLRNSKPLTISDEVFDDSQTRTCGDWASCNGRGFLCSTEV